MTQVRRLIPIILCSMLVLTACGGGGGVKRTASTPGATPAVADSSTPVTMQASPVATPASAGVATPGPTSTPTATPPPAKAQAATPKAKVKPQPKVYYTLRGDKQSTPPIRPIGVQIDNAPGARPQTGLTAADLVYETPTEAQLTRYTAFYQTRAPQVVGPVRSARLVDLQVIPEYDGILAYSGASVGVSGLLNAQKVYRLQVQTNAAASSWRDNSRYAPDNLYASVAKLRDIAKDFGWARPSKADSMVFGPAPSGGQFAQGVSIPYSTGPVDFRYNVSTKSYDRFMNGSPDVDAGNGQTISPSNVIVLFTNFRTTNIVEDEAGELSLDPKLQGQGTAWILRDNQRYVVKWERDSLSSVTRFVDPKTGKDVPLAQGQTWICLIPQWLSASIDK